MKVIGSLLFAGCLIFWFELCQSKPNFIVFFADDVGYGDLYSYGHPVQEKGPIDQMAEEGMRFTKWYTGDALCSPSRAALLTGRLPIRIGVVGPNRVFWQWDAGGLPKSEKTIPEALQEHGYATGMVGKWHLGINQYEVNDGNHLPFHHGFQYVGTNYPYGQNYNCDPQKFTTEEMSVKCFKYLNTTFVQQPTTMINSTYEMVEDARSFIEQNADAGIPFFFYMPLLQTHCSLFCSPGFCGTSRRGLYGDNMNEMAWAVGQVLDSVRDLGIAENTLAFYISDNGAQIEMCNQGGSSGMLKGGKASLWEGGIRVPGIAWWPGTIPAGRVSHEIASTMDLYATLLELAGGNANDDGIVRDGRSIADMLTKEVSSPHEYLFHYCSDNLMAVRSGSYKVTFYTQNTTPNFTELCVEGIPKDDVITNIGCYGDSVTEHDPPLVFNTDEDPSEDYPLDSSEYFELINDVKNAVADHKAGIVPVDSLLGLKDEELQPCCNFPICTCNYDEAASDSTRNEL